MIVDRLKYIGATNVQKISVEEALKKFHVIVFEEKMQHGPEDKSCTNYVISDGLTGIAERVFYGCSALKAINVPEVMNVSDWDRGEDVQAIYY